jgi:Tol biopolymer transport system component
VPRILFAAVAFASIAATAGIGGQSRGFGGGRSAAPTVARPSQSSILRLMPLTATAAAPAIALARITFGVDGSEANNGSDRPSLSADGRFVAFESDASNLVSGDTNGVRDIFVFDRATGQTTRENLAPGGAQANDFSFAPVSDATGRHVAFRSSATNLIAGGTQSFTSHVYVRDRQDGTTVIADASSAGGVGDGAALEYAISADGRFVAFSSLAQNLDASDVNQCADVFVRDLSSGATERVKLTAGGVEASCVTGGSHPALSADGRYVAFSSDAKNVSAATELAVYVRDRVAAVTTLESVGADGKPLRAAIVDSISGDGRFVLFRVLGSFPGSGLYLRDRAAGQTLGPVPGVLNSQISVDGLFVSYVNDVHQAFAVDLTSGTFIPIANDAGAISAVGGAAVAFSSSVAQIPGDTNRLPDIYVATASAATLPGVPRDLAASVFGSTLTLTWNPPLGGAAPTAYVIEAGSTNGATDVANFSTGSTATHFSANVSGGGTFYIRVRAANGAGVSPPSNQILVTIGAAAAPPGAPIALNASITGGSTVTLTWARPLSGGAVTTYLVEAGSAPGLSNLANIDIGGATPSFVVTGVGAGTYYVRVRGANAGGVGPPSNEVLVVIR